MDTSEPGSDRENTKLVTGSGTDHCTRNGRQLELGVGRRRFFQWIKDGRGDQRAGCHDELRVDHQF